MPSSGDFLVLVKAEWWLVILLQKLHFVTSVLKYFACYFLGPLQRPGLVSLGAGVLAALVWTSIFFSPWLSKGEWLHSPGGELVQAGVGEYVADQHNCPGHQRHVHAHAGGAWLDQLEVSGEGRMRTSARGGVWPRPWSRESQKHPGNRGSIIGRLFIFSYHNQITICSQNISLGSESSAQ